MKVADTGVAIPELINSIKKSIMLAGISRVDTEREIRLESIQLTLRALAVHSLGGGVEFRIPVIGMAVRIGSKISRQVIHTIEINLVPPELKPQMQLRDGEVADALVEAYNTIRATIASASSGEDPFTLNDGCVTMSFAITEEGNISLGVDGGFSHEVTQTLRLGLIGAR